MCDLCMQCYHLWCGACVGGSKNYTIILTVRLYLHLKVMLRFYFTYKEPNWGDIMHKTTQNTQIHNKHHHHGDGATYPSSSGDSMNQCRLSRGGACAYNCPRLSKKDFNRFIKVKEIGLVPRQQWWLKRHPLLPAAANLLQPGVSFNGL